MAMLGITMVVLSLAVVVNIRGTSLKQRDLEYQLKEETLAKQVALEEAAGGGAGGVPHLCPDEAVCRKEWRRKSWAWSISPTRSC